MPHKRLEIYLKLTCLSLTKLDFAILHTKVQFLTSIMSWCIARSQFMGPYYWGKLTVLVFLFNDGVASECFYTFRLEPSLPIHVNCNTNWKHSQQIKCQHFLARSYSTRRLQCISVGESAMILALLSFAKWVDSIFIQRFCNNCIEMMTMLSDLKLR